MTNTEYRARIDELAAYKNFSVADSAYFEKLTNLRNDLFDLITNNMDDAEYSGTAYYVSNDGDDTNDGLTPATAWKTLTKVNEATFNSGDAVLFERGGLWRGFLRPQSNTTYSAYGTGCKPRIMLSIDARNNNWKKTDTENIWVYDVPIEKSVGLILFNDGEYYGEKRRESFENLKQNFDFLHAVTTSGVAEENADMRVYLYYDGNNPADDFWGVELSITKSVVTIPGHTHDVTIQNLELRLGQDYFFCSHTKNIILKYCSMYWMGGHEDLRGNRFGGGGGCWFGCDNMVYDHCYFLQHFDAGVTPQYDMNDKKDVVHNKFIVKDCLFEKCEYSFEFFATNRSENSTLFKNIYFGYNLCLEGGKGFGTKTSASAYLKSWEHDNFSENFIVEKNIFDRAAARTLDISARATKRGEFSMEQLPTMRNNVYIEYRDKDFARINRVKYLYNEESYNTLKDLNFETDAVFMFCEDK